MARLYVVRHGNTFDPGETVTRVGGRTDMPLSVSGHAQAEALRTCFACVRFAAALASPLVRTRATARTVLSARSDAPALLIEPFLREIDYGPDENQPEAAVEARVGAAALAAWDTNAQLPPGWHADIPAIREGWRLLLVKVSRLEDTDNVLVVTSNGIARFLPDIVDSKPGDIDRKLKTGAWAEISVAETGSRIDAWNLRP